MATVGVGFSIRHMPFVTFYVAQFIKQYLEDR